MAGLSSVMAITRPLGEVDLTAMNRCVGVYRVYTIGGGGGGGGFDDFYGWFGGRGRSGSRSNYGQTRALVPPIIISEGAGGRAGVDARDSGESGGTTTMRDSRATSISESGGVGGESAYERRLASVEAASRVYCLVTSRFSATVTAYTGTGSPPSGSIPVPRGRGGDSLEDGNAGGIITAFRIG